MADVVESIIGAVTFRCGLETAHEFIKRKYAINSFRSSEKKQGESSKRNPLLERDLEDYDK